VLECLAETRLVGARFLVALLRHSAARRGEPPAKLAKQGKVVSFLLAGIADADGVESLTAFFECVPGTVEQGSRPQLCAAVEAAARRGGVLAVAALSRGARKYDIWKGIVDTVEAGGGQVVLALSPSQAGRVAEGVTVAELMEEEETTSTSHGRYSARQHALMRLATLLALGQGVGGSPIELNPQLLGTRGLLRAATRDCDILILESRVSPTSSSSEAMVLAGVDPSSISLQSLLLLALKYGSGPPDAKVISLQLSGEAGQSHPAEL